MKQDELDKAERYVLTKLLGNVDNPIISRKIQILCIAKNIDLHKTINEKLLAFENWSKDFMTNTGYYDGKRLTQALTLKYPILNGLEIPSCKPIELFTVIDGLIGFDSLGKIIQNL